MARDNGLCVCVVKPHGVTDKPLGEAILQLCVSYLRVCVSAHATKHDEVSFGSSGTSAF
jgi:hypothetical protein